MTCETGTLFWRVGWGCKSLWCQDVADRQTYRTGVAQKCAKSNRQADRQTKTEDSEHGPVFRPLFEYKSAI